LFGNVIAKFRGMRGVVPANAHNFRRCDRGKQPYVRHRKNLRSLSPRVGGPRWRGNFRDRVSLENSETRQGSTAPRNKSAKFHEKECIRSAVGSAAAQRETPLRAKRA